MNTRALPPALVETELVGFGPRYRGKVRDVYRPGDGRLVLVTTDRLSAFDHVLHEAIPLKGQVLNKLTAHFFMRTADACPNHLLAVPDPNVTIAVACEALPVEFVVRNYLAGHSWRVYRAGERTLCGQPLPEGMREGQRLPRPILTPTTKAKSGHDQDISRDEVIARELVDRATFDEVEELARRLFARGTELAERCGLILVDTKYEFGRAPDGRILVIDEVHTPDSSRYYYADDYESRLSAGQPQRQLSKEFVREWLMEHGFRGLEGQQLPHLPWEFVQEVSNRYVELYEKITGEIFEADLHPQPKQRIQQALVSAI